MNEELWLQGMYNTKAFQTVLGNAFGDRNLKYFTEPLDLFEKTEAEKQMEIRQERQRLIEFLNGLKKSADMKQGVGKNG